MNALLIIAAAVAAYFILQKTAPEAGGDSTELSFNDYAPTGTGGGSGFYQPDETTLGEASTMQSLRAWAEAIKHHEGWAPGTPAYRNNNPGNLVFAGQEGATGKDSRGFAKFPDEQTGMAALERDLAAKVRKYPDYSILQIMARYLGNSDPNNIPADGKIYANGKLQGDALAYAADVATRLGVSMTGTLSEIFG